MGYRIQLEPVESSSLAARGYDAERQVLAIQFKNGHIFHMGSFPPEKAAEFGAAPSVGKFYSEHIKGKYPGMKMTGECPACSAVGLVAEPCACGEGHYTEAERKRRYCPMCDEWMRAKECAKCGMKTETSKPCPHGNKAGECDTCDRDSDFAFDAAREGRR